MVEEVVLVVVVVALVQKTPAQTVDVDWANNARRTWTEGKYAWGTNDVDTNYAVPGFEL